MPVSIKSGTAVQQAEGAGNVSAVWRLLDLIPGFAYHNVQKRARPSVARGRRRLPGAIRPDTEGDDGAGA